MAFEQTITIVNNSGKIISTGKQLLAVFKEARDHYQDIKTHLKSEKSERRAGLTRSRTYDRPSSRSVYGHHENYDQFDHYDPRGYHHQQDDDFHYQYNDEASQRRSVYDAHSETGSRRSVRSKSVHSSRRRHHSDKDSQYGGSRSRAGSALTANNLKTWTEVSSTAPSKVPSKSPTKAPSRAPPISYRNPFPESRIDDGGRSIADSHYNSTPRTLITRRQSCSEIDGARPYFPQNNHEIAVRQGTSRNKEIDMDLAYGDCPPDLEHRIDLDDPACKELVRQDQAQALARKVEHLLDEAQCLQHSAANTIASLQQNPDAAAAVALSLAELSALISKMSPAFLGLLKGGSPAVFALLASPQFLIGTGAVVGMTVIMFGGWKIIQRVREANAAKAAIAYEQQQQYLPQQQAPRALRRAESEFSAGVDEALLVEEDEEDFNEELSTVETWRRGIPASAHETADIELITPEADRTTRRGRGYKDDDDMKSMRSARTSKTSKTSKSRSGGDNRKKSTGGGSRGYRHGAAESVAGSHRGSGKRSSSTTGTSKKKHSGSSGGHHHHSHGQHRHHNHRESSSKTVDDGKSEKGDKMGMLMKYRPNMLKAVFKNDKKDVRTAVHA